MPVAATATSVHRIGRNISVPKQLRNLENHSVYLKMKQSPVNFREKLDMWMKQSVVEIVKRLSETPLLVQVFSDRTTAEKAEEDDWVSVTEKWENGVAPIPDGMIFIDQIEDDCEDDITEVSCQVDLESTTRAWGIVVQGRGQECHPACYLLKTDQVIGSGLGLRSTRFCLVPVTSFAKTASSQLTNSWLLGAM